MAGDDDLLDVDIDFDANGDDPFDPTDDDSAGVGPEDATGFDPTQIGPSDDPDPTGPDDSLFPGLPCYCDGDIPDDLGFDPVDPQSLPVDPDLDTIVGNPDTEAQYWVYQGDGNGTCAPTSVAMILSDVLGEDVPSDVVIQRAIDLGVMSYDPSKDGLDAWSGMNDAGIMVLAESFGLDVNLRYGDTADLANYLASGHEITVGLDADEIWTGTDDDATDGGTNANHQVVVTGIDLDNGVVYLNDSGTPDGKAEAIPLSQFEDAWADANNSMIVTDLPKDEEAQDIDVDELTGDTPANEPVYDGIVPPDANYFLPPSGDTGETPDSDQPDDGTEPAPVIDLGRTPIEAPVPADDGVTQLLILPFTFLARFVDRVL